MPVRGWRFGCSPVAAATSRRKQISVAGWSAAAVRERLLADTRR